MKTNIISEQQPALIISPKNALLMSLLLVSSTGGFANNNFQQRMLFTPSESALQAELKGRVMIYDSLDEKVVNAVLDQQFDRIESMMFVRVINEDESDEITDEDDDCD